MSVTHNISVGQSGRIKGDRLGFPAENQEKHGVSFSHAHQTFAGPQRVIAKDETPSLNEERFYCFGEVDGGVLTVRFTCRASIIRIFGAGYWRKG